jgi:hypothetical protein
MSDELPYHIDSQQAWGYDPYMICEKHVRQAPLCVLLLCAQVHAAHADLTARFPSRPEVKGSHLADLQQRHREQAQRTQQQQQHEPEKQQAESQRPHHEVGQGARPEHGSQQLAGAQTSTATPAPTYPCGPDATALLQAKMAAIDPLLPFDAKHALQNASIAGRLWCVRASVLSKCWYDYMLATATGLPHMDGKTPILPHVCVYLQSHSAYTIASVCVQPTSKMLACCHPTSPLLRRELARHGWAHGAAWGMVCDTWCCSTVWQVCKER